MGITKTEIVKRGLFAIGVVYQTDNVDDDLSNQAAIYRTAYEQALDNAMSLYAPWNIFKKYEQLSQVAGETPPWDWSYLYQIPHEATQIITITPITKYDIYFDKIACNVSPAYIIYTFRPEPYQMPMHFYTYLTYEFAVLCGPSIAKSEGLYSDAVKKLDSFRKNAQAKDAQQQTQKSIYSSPIMDARFSDFGNYYGG